MNSIEEKLWNYIDGTCTEQERKAIAALIAGNQDYQQQYNELLKLNAEIAAMEIDEPPMAFTYNVMESIRAEQAVKPLNAAINKRIILSIAAFFIFTIALLIVITIANVNWHTLDTTTAIPDLNTKPLTNLFTSPVVKGFLFFDVVMALYLLDGYLRRKDLAKQQ